MRKDHIDFQDNSVPLAYLITIRCYGTWLHGDKRGSMNRLGRNRYGAIGIEPLEGLENSDRKQLLSEPVRLDARARNTVEHAIKEVCNHRGYRLLAVQSRTEHVHIVVASRLEPEPIMNAFKSYATRKLRADGQVEPFTKIWSRHGSTKYIWSERNVEIAIDYVLYGQGDELPKFEL